MVFIFSFLSIIADSNFLDRWTFQDYIKNKDVNSFLMIRQYSLGGYTYPIGHIGFTEWNAKLDLKTFTDTIKQVCQDCTWKEGIDKDIKTMSTYSPVINRLVVYKIKQIGQKTRIVQTTYRVGYQTVIKDEITPIMDTLISMETPNKLAIKSTKFNFFGKLYAQSGGMGSPAGGMGSPAGGGASDSAPPSMSSPYFMEEIDKNKALLDLLFGKNDPMVSDALIMEGAINPEAAVDSALLKTTEAALTAVGAQSLGTFGYATVVITTFRLLQGFINDLSGKEAAERFEQRIYPGSEQEHQIALANYRQLEQKLDGYVNAILKFGNDDTRREEFHAINRELEQLTTQCSDEITFAPRIEQLTQYKEAIENYDKSVICQQVAEFNNIIGVAEATLRMAIRSSIIANNIIIREKKKDNKAILKLSQKEANKFEREQARGKTPEAAQLEKELIDCVGRLGNLHPDCKELSYKISELSYTDEGVQKSGETDANTIIDSLTKKGNELKLELSCYTPVEVIQDSATASAVSTNQRLMCTSKIIDRKKIEIANKYCEEKLGTDTTLSYSSDPNNTSTQKDEEFAKYKADLLSRCAKQLSKDSFNE